MSKSKRTIGRGIANDASKRLGQSCNFWDVDDYLAARIDRAVRAAFKKGWEMGQDWELARTRGGNTTANALHSEYMNFNKPAKRSRK